jgi:phosphonate transport system substrate-binding protein
MVGAALLCGAAIFAGPFFPVRTGAGILDKESPKEITVGFAPMLGPEKTRQKFQPMIDHLQKTLGIKVNALVPENYVKLIEALKNNQVEFAYMGPSNYIEAHKITGAKVIAIELSPDGKPGYHSIIISSKKSGIVTLDQAAGKVFAFTDSNSTSGFVIPNVYFIKERKQTPAAFASRTAMAGTHLNLLKGVANGTYDIGATNDIDFARSAQDLKLKPDSFNILWQSDLIPGAPMVARKDISSAFRKQFLDALLALNQDKKALAKMQCGGYVEGKDSDFDYIRELENFLPKNQPLK